MATGLSTYVSFSSGNFRVRVYFTQEYEPTTGQSTIKITGVYVISYGYYGYKYYPDGYVRINDTYYYMNSYSGTHNVTINGTGTLYSIKKSNGYKFTGSATVDHDENGDASFVIGVNLNFYTTSGSGGSGWGVSNKKTFSTTSDSYAMAKIETYSLSITESDNVDIEAYRDASTYVGVEPGALERGAKLYAGDTVSFTFTPSANYELLTKTVNDEVEECNTTSAVVETVVVSGDVIVSATSRPLASDVSILGYDTDGSLFEQDVTIHITRYDEVYTHSLYYTLYDSDGNAYAHNDMILIGDEKTDGVDIPWTIPNFYLTLSSATYAKLVITCVTYNGDVELGVSTTDASASSVVIEILESESAPIITDMKVIDVNQASIALTGDESVLVRNLSNARFSFSVTPQNEASLSWLSINDMVVMVSDILGPSENSHSLYETFEPGAWDKDDIVRFECSATDSRGYKSRGVMSAGSDGGFTVVNYIPPTINADVQRYGATSGQLQLIISESSFFSGRFGKDPNTLNGLKIEYQYIASGTSTWSDPIVICSNQGEFESLAGVGSIDTTTSTYKTLTPIVFGSSDESVVEPTFPYDRSYQFRIIVTDSVGSVVSSSITVKRGLPVYDWGEDDFNFNVPAMAPDFLIKTDESARKSVCDVFDDLKSVKEISAQTLDEDGKIVGIGGNEIAHPTFPSVLSSFSNDSGFISYNLLWENESPDEDFEATTLTSANLKDTLDKYSYYIIASRMNTSTPIRVTTTHYIPDSGDVLCEASYSRGETGSRLIRQRAFTVNRGNSTISFETGIYTGTSSYSSYDSVMVPLYIIGVHLPALT